MRETNMKTRLLNRQYLALVAGSFAIWLILCSVFFSLVRVDAILLPLINVPNITVVTRCLEYLLVPGSHELVGNLIFLAFLAYCYELLYPRERFRYLGTSAFLFASLLATTYRDLIWIINWVFLSPFFVAFIVAYFLKKIIAKNK